MQPLLYHSLSQSHPCLPFLPAIKCSFVGILGSVPHKGSNGLCREPLTEMLSKVPAWPPGMWTLGRNDDHCCSVLFQGRNVRLLFYSPNVRNHHLITALQATVESRTQKGPGPQEQPSADGQLFANRAGPHRQASSPVPVWCVLAEVPSTTLANWTYNLFSTSFSSLSGPSREATGALRDTYSWGRQVRRTGFV